MLRTSLLSASAFILLAQAPTPISIQGRILGPDARPIRGAVVALVPTQANPGLSPVPEVTTGSQGQFQLKAPAGNYGFTVTAPGYQPHFHNLELKAGTPLPPLAIPMEKGGNQIKGRLLPAPGRPLAGARLAFYKISQDDGDAFYSVVKHGRFEITLATGDYLALAEAKGQSGNQRFEVRGSQPNAFIQLRPEPTPADAQTLTWIKRKAIPLKGVEAGKGFSDMEPLKALVGDATVVGLGEATHGTREFFQLKHRMLEFLATEMGFTVFAIEANLPEAFAVNDFVLTGKGDPAKALAGLYFWTWNTEEVLDMIRWMRTYNEDPAHTKKLRFYGVDMQTETVAYAQVKAWLDGTAPEEAAKLREIKEGMAKLPSRSSGKPAEETLKAWGAAAQALEAMITRLEAKTFPGEDFDRQRQNLRVLAQFANMQADPAGGYAARDVSMAANLRWIQTREQGAKIVLWAHNAHISFRPGGEDGIPNMGWHLRQALGKAYLPFGFAFREGSFQAKSGDPKNRNLQVFEVKPQTMGTLDAALAATRLPFLALDLRNRPLHGPVRRWLESPQGTWGIGALFTTGQERQYQYTRPVTECYDALLFVNHTTSARPVGGRPKEVPIRAASAKVPANLGFEEGLSGWSNPKDLGYTATVVDQGAKEGSHCLQVAYQAEPKPNAWWTAMQAVDAEPFRGKKVRLMGWIRTDAKPDFKAMCWVRIDCKSGMGFFDNMMQRPVTGTDWTEVTIEGPVALDAVNLNFGCMAMGAGTAWFDGIRVEMVP